MGKTAVSCTQNYFSSWAGSCDQAFVKLLLALIYFLALASLFTIDTSSVSVEFCINLFMSIAGIFVKSLACTLRKCLKKP